MAHEFRFRSFGEFSKPDFGQRISENTWENTTRDSSGMIWGPKKWSGKLPKIMVMVTYYDQLIAGCLRLVHAS